MMDLNMNEMLIAKLDLSPGDLLAINFAMPLTIEQLEIIRDAFSRVLPAGVRTIVLQGNPELKIIKAPVAELDAPTESAEIV